MLALNEVFSLHVKSIYSQAVRLICLYLSACVPQYKKYTGLQELILYFQALEMFDSFMLLPAYTLIRPLLP